MARAAASTSLNVVSAFAALAGLTSTATRAAAGTSSRRSSSRFAANSSTEKIDPGQVAARPGEAGDKTKPDRVFADDEDDRDRRGCRLGRQRRQGASGRGDHGDPPANQFGRQRRQPIDIDSRPSGIRSPRSRPRHSRSPSGPGEMRADGPRTPSGDVASRNPITGIAGCCARAASGHAAAAPPSSVMNSRRFIRSPRRRGRAASAAR